MISLAGCGTESPEKGGNYMEVLKFSEMRLK